MLVKTRMTLSWLNICVSTIIIKMEYNTLEVMKIIKCTIERNKNITIILKTENDIYFRTIHHKSSCVPK